jgi:hypothetical protein
MPERTDEPMTQMCRVRRGFSRLSEEQSFSTEKGTGLPRSAPAFFDRVRITRNRRVLESLGPTERRLQASCKLLCRANAPVVQEDHPWLFVCHVIVDGNDLDVRMTQR